METLSVYLLNDCKNYGIYIVNRKSVIIYKLFFSSCLLFTVPLDGVVDRLDLVHVKCVLSVSLQTQRRDPLPSSQRAQKDFLRAE